MIFLTTMKKTLSSGKRLTNFVKTVLCGGFVLRTESLEKNGEFGEVYISKTDLFLESLTGIKANKTGQTPGNI